MSDIDNLREHVDAALKLSGTKQRYSGVVDGYDRVGTTIFIVSGEQKFLAFADPKRPLKAGDQVTFRIDGVRAVDVHKVPAE
jgi:hypothetical protein